MNKKIFLTLFVMFSVALILSGCAKTTQKQTQDNKQNNFSTSTKMFGNSSSTMMNIGADGTMIDLEIGKKITVMGSGNADGSINAQNIFIGEIPRMSRPSSTLENVNIDKDKQQEEGFDRNGGRKRVSERPGRNDAILHRRHQTAQVYMESPEL